MGRERILALPLTSCALLRLRLPIGKRGLVRVPTLQDWYKFKEAVDTKRSINVSGPHNYS